MERCHAGHFHSLVVVLAGPQLDFRNWRQRLLNISTNVVDLGLTFEDRNACRELRIAAEVKAVLSVSTGWRTC